MYFDYTVDPFPLTARNSILQKYNGVIIFDAQFFSSHFSSSFIEIRSQVPMIKTY